MGFVRVPLKNKQPSKGVHLGDTAESQQLVYDCSEHHVKSGMQVVRVCRGSQGPMGTF